LATALNDGDATVRLAAAKGLRTLGTAASQSTPNLIAVLDDDASDVATEARAALVAVGVDTIPGLLRVVAIGSGQARHHATVALIALGQPSLPGLITTLAATSVQARKASIAAIATILEDTEAPDSLAPALVPLLTDKDPEVAEAARRLSARLDAE
ncbi:MAG: hypothetical protein JKY37_24150, partial [Nannocystaceae bacterium]|nr:hypothetical protein [Nannocystaceae bacterium]